MPYLLTESLKFCSGIDYCVHHPILLIYKWGEAAGRGLPIREMSICAEVSIKSKSEIKVEQKYHCQRHVHDVHPRMGECLDLMSKKISTHKS